VAKSRPCVASEGALPTFVIIGAMKAGTDSLFHYVRSHPAVFMATTKELDFFVEELNLPRGQSWYRAQFAEAPISAMAIGEASTSYTKFPMYGGVPGRMAACIPDARLIYMLRDPVERIVSHYHHEWILGRERRPINEAVLEDGAYVQFSCYGTQLSRYLEWFPMQQIHVLRTEDLRARRRESLSAVFDFIGVDGTFVPSNIEEEYHRSVDKRVTGRSVAQLTRTKAYAFLRPVVPQRVKALARDKLTTGLAEKPHVADRVRAELGARLADDIALLKTIVGHDFDAWGLAK
jgi:hypothetical protein